MAFLIDAIRKRIERECDMAEHPQGMSVHDGRTRCLSSDVRRLLHIIDFCDVRLVALQKYQKQLPEPHRTAICNILANGKAAP